MKTSLFTLLLLVTLFLSSQAQWLTNGTSLYYSNGNVGIGTSTPAHALDVWGNGLLIHSATGIHSEILIRDNSIEDPATATDIGNIAVNYLGYNSGSTYYRNFSVYNGKGTSIAQFTGATGFMGLGTTNPARLLEIQQSSNGRSYLRIRENSINTATDGGAFLELTGTRSDGTIGYYAGVLGGRENYLLHNRGYLSFYVDNNDGKSLAERMRVTGDGNVLIGKTTQTNTTYKLDVSGAVRANRVVVNTTGADFVFNPAYNLLPLSDLRKFINQHHHLPGIEPAAQMQKEGLNVGDNQIKLLQKIEELTLYVIEKDQEIDTLKQQVRVLMELMNKK